MAVGGAGVAGRSVAEVARVAEALIVAEVGAGGTGSAVGRSNLASSAGQTAGNASCQELVGADLARATAGSSEHS